MRSARLARAELRNAPCTLISGIYQQADQVYHVRDAVSD